MCYPSHIKISSFSSSIFLLGNLKQDSTVTYVGSNAISIRGKVKWAGKIQSLPCVGIEFVSFATPFKTSTNFEFH
jgi:hypothetical protein